MSGAGGAGRGGVIAVDGLAGSGKSTVAGVLADRLGLERLDTGAMYRAITFAALRDGIDPDDGPALTELARRVTIEVEAQVLVDGQDATVAIRGPEVTGAVSAVSSHPGVRAGLVVRQRAWVAVRGGGVVEGRDIGTVVFPDARLKVFLTADCDERARRRALEGAGTGSSEELSRRDHLDSSRQASPLAVAEGALAIDTTGRSVEDVVAEILERLMASETAGRPATAGPAEPPATAGSPGPDPGARTAILELAPGPVARAWYAVASGLVKVWALACFRLSVEGRENLPVAGPYLLAPVHRSNIDFLMVSTVTRQRVRFMGKEELWKVAALGRLVGSLGAFPVRRDKVDRESLRCCIEILANGEPLTIFPEGTRQSGPVVQELFEGAAYVAARAGVPVVPVGIAGSEAAMPKGAKLIRPVKIHLVVGRPLWGQAQGKGGPGPSRVSRSVLRQRTDQLRVELQKVFDRALELNRR
ncbi:MAG: (d)CMP kinase [Acidimicrobiales bacterium]|nr:MAG: (d)CMP kinase [Acidimicrobiales bacterium]